MIDEIKVVAADIDLTLTTKGGELPPVTIDAFEELHKQGVKIGLATGRVIEDREKMMGRNWGLSFEFDYIVGLNGGMVYNREKDSLWSIPLLTSEQMKEILEYMVPACEKYNLCVNVEGGNNHSAMYLRDELLEVARRHGFVFEDRTGDIDGFCEKPAYKFLFRGDGSHDDEVRKYVLDKFGDRYQIVSTFTGTLEVMQKNVDKGEGVRHYCNDIGVSMDNVIAFGDSENDNAMLEKCGWGVCLKNGAEKTKSYADAVTDYDCEEGGVGHYLFDYCINK